MNKVKILNHISLAILSVSWCVQAFAQIDLDNEENRIAYSIGANIGQNLQAQQVVEGIDLDVFLAGMKDALDGEMQLDQDSMMQAIQTFVQRQADEEAASLQDNLIASQEFLQSNALKEGITSLESGLQYEVLVSGPSDGESPTTTDSVLAHYHGTLPNGSVFDSSVDRGEPATFGVSQVISGWTEALQLMKVGDKWRLYIPPDMAYGEASPTPAIPPNSALVFEVELLEVR
jgi:FKBP-type peptidyl-prolyl cis-trans isomerase FklB